MRTLALVLLLGSIGAPAICGEKDTVFSAPRDKVYSAALETVASEWRVDQADKASGLISFSKGETMFTPGQNVSLVLSETEMGTKVLVSSQMRVGATLSDVSSKERAKVRTKVLRMIAERLHKDGLIPESEIPPKK